MFFIEVSCTTSLHLIDQKNCKNCSIVNYYFYNLQKLLYFNII